MEARRLGVKTLTSKKSTPTAQTRDALRLLCKTDLYVFAREVLGYKDLTPSFHKPLCDYFQTTAYKRNLYMVQRGGFKTSVLAIAANLQRILRNPDIRILIASNKLDNAEAILAEIKGHFANPILIGLFPNIFHADPTKSDVWKTSQVSVKTTKRRREPTITAIGLHGELVGRHYDHGTFDDLVGLENSQAREERQRTIEWWKAAQSILDPGSTEDVVGTPWDFDDLYAYLQTQREKYGMQLGVYKRACWEPAPHGFDAGPPFGRVVSTFPERFPVHESERTHDKQDALLTIKAEAGSARFAAQYLLTPVDDETAVFPRRLAVIWPRHKMPDIATMWLVMTVDPAESTNGWADYTAFAIAGFDAENRMFVYHLDRGRWTETQVMREVYAWFNRYAGVRAVGIEAVAFQRYLLHLFTAEGEKRGQYLPIFKLERDTKKTKRERIRVLQPFWESGHIILADDLPMLEEFLDEAAKFRLHKEATHDDMLDALADCLQLRVRPAQPDPHPERRALPPEDAERLDFEEQVTRERAARAAAPLDAGSLRMAWAHRQHFAERERVQQTAVMTEYDETWR